MAKTMAVAVATAMMVQTAMAMAKMMAMMAMAVSVRMALRRWFGDGSGNGGMALQIISFTRDLQQLSSWSAVRRPRAVYCSSDGDVWMFCRGQRPQLVISTSFRYVQSAAMPWAAWGQDVACRSMQHAGTPSSPKMHSGVLAQRLVSPSFSPTDFSFVFPPISPSIFSRSLPV